MAEYRVTALYYRFMSEVENDRFDDAEPQSGTLGDWEYSLEAGLLKAVPTAEFRDRGAARRDLEQYLRGWEQSAFLSPSRFRIRFEYDRSEMEDADPQPGSVTVFPDTLTLKMTAFAPTIVRGFRYFPEPDLHFRHTYLTDRLTERLRRLRDNEAELPAVAYFVLDSLEHAFGGTESGKRPRAAAFLDVDVAVLRKLGDLTSRPDPDIGRKSGAQSQPLTSAEREWIHETLVLLVRRVGEYEAGAVVSKIGMAGLPPLP